MAASERHQIFKFIVWAEVGGVPVKSMILLSRKELPTDAEITRALKEKLARNLNVNFAALDNFTYQLVPKRGRR